jgi:hypothetical protein
MSKEGQVKETAVTGNGTIKTPKMSRRKLLRSAAVGMPAVLTLHSGAALARSSNIVGMAPAGTRDLEGNALCLDTRLADPLWESNQVDLGEPAQGTVNVVSERIYYPDKNKSGTPHSADMICKNGGTYYYHEDGWHEVNLPANGVIVSATAMVSVSLRGDVLFNRIA